MAAITSRHLVRRALTVWVAIGLLMAGIGACIVLGGCSAEQLSAWDDFLIDINIKKEPVATAPELTPAEEVTP